MTKPIPSPWHVLSCQAAQELWQIRNTICKRLMLFVVSLSQLTYFLLSPCPRCCCPFSSTAPSVNVTSNSIFYATCITFYLSKVANEFSFKAMTLNKICWEMYWVQPLENKFHFMHFHRKILRAKWTSELLKKISLFKYFYIFSVEENEKNY